jgi:aspartyl-tRNA(Asn)/glutamyl-tRNA(Gln) amidotransferase subunit C
MISEDDVEKLATLARLELDPTLKPVITTQVNSILEYVQQLEKVNTSEVTAMSHTHEAINVMREDQVCPSGSQPPATPLGSQEVPRQEMLKPEDLLKNAPDHSGRFIRVPLIVE